MDRVLSSTRLKTYSISVLLLSAVLLCSACSSQRPRERYGRQESLGSGPSTSFVPAIAAGPLYAPWDLWAADLSTQGNFKQADQLLASGQLEAAARAYRDFVEQDPSERIREDALVRRTTTLLKLGKAAQVMREVSDFQKARGRAGSDLSPEQALIIGFSYVHLGNIEQALAWFSLAYRQTGGGGSALPKVAERYGEQLVQRTPENEFEAAANKWQGDALVGMLFSRERARRKIGGRPLYADDAKWFSAATYQGNTNLAFADPAPADSAAYRRPEVGSLPSAIHGAAVVGVLLPLTGQYA
ncbi:MAG: hypothetical protein KDD44_12905, partial [Bdellovibrionales bacterium]|nr:hypothetical protein [Bdellovibrionales bacterium]